MRRCALLVLLASFPATAFAQQYSTEIQLRRVGPQSSVPDRLSVFVTGYGSWSDQDATFDVSSKSGNRTAELVFEATGMEMRTYAPQLGLTYAFNPSFLMYAAAGVAYVDLSERRVDIPGTLYADQHAPIFEYDLRPGLAATVGGSYAIAKFANFTFVSGGRLSYTSSSHLNEDAVTGNIRVTDPSSNTEIDELRTTDVTLRMLNLRANAGLEWRPAGSYLINDFGLTLGFSYAFGSITKAYRLSHTVNGTVSRVEETDTVGVSLLPANLVGVYYGWSVFIPRFGLLGVEVQALNALQASLTYEYIF